MQSRATGVGKQLKVKICRIDSLASGKIRTARVLARRIAVVQIEGRIYAFEADCKHMKQSLGGGTIEGNVITCPAHGWKYDLATGQCLTEKWARLKTFDVYVENGDLFVDL
jgi:nitrite reductase/ring-hydroxylating ferredoxin subunit